MAENQIPFQTSLEDEGMTIGIDLIVSSLERLDEVGLSTADTLTLAFSSMEDGLKSLGAVAGDVVGKMTSGLRSLGEGITRAVTPLTDGFARMAGAANDAGSMIERLEMTASGLSTTIAMTASAAGDEAAGLVGLGAAMADTTSMTDAMKGALGETNGTLESIRASGQAAASGIAALSSQVKGLLDNTMTSVMVLVQQNQILAGIRTAAQDAVSGISQLGTAITDLRSIVMSVDAQLFDTVNVLGDVKAAAESSAQLLGDLSAKMDQLIKTVSDLAGALPKAAAGLNDLADGEKRAGEGAGFFHTGGTQMLAMMGGFSIFNEVTRSVGEFWHAAIDGNAALERLHATLKDFVGGADAQELTNWSLKFATTIPDTFMNLQKGMVTLATIPGMTAASMEPLMGALATIAGHVGVTLPVATQAFMRDFFGRSTMMQQQLRVTNDELKQFGLQTDANGKIVRESLAGAVMAYAAAKFPGGLAEIMKTMTGQATNLQDFMQILAMQFGRPSFNDFKQGLADILTFLYANRDAIFAFAQGVGNVFAAAIEFVMPLIGQFVTFLQNNHAALYAVIGLLAGTFLGVLLAVGAAVVAMLGPIFGVASAIGFLVGPIVGFIVQSEPMVTMLQDLWQAASDLADVIGSTLADVFSLVAGPIGQMVDALFGVQQSADATDQPMNRAQMNAHNLAEAGKAGAGAIRSLGGALGAVVGTVAGFAGNVKAVAEHIDGLVKSFKSGDLSGFGQTLGNIVKPLLLLAGMGAGIAAFASGLLTIGGAGSIVSGAIGVLAGVLTFLISPFDFLVAFWPAISGFFAGLGAIVTGLADAAFPLLFQAVLVLGQVFANPVAVAAALGEALGGIVIAALPVIAIVVAIALAIAGVVFAFIHWWQTNEAFRKGVMAMIGDVLGLGKVLMDSLKPAWAAIQSGLKQLQPAWDQIVKAFDEAKPALLVIGGILLTVLAVAIGIVVAVLRGLFTALGPLIAGAIQMIVGVVQVLVAIVSIIFNIIGGLVRIVWALIHGDWQGAWKAAVDMVHNLVENVGLLFSGLGNIIGGFFGGLWGAIVGFITGFVQGIISWFQHLFDILVGHSLIPDMVKGIIQWIQNLVSQFIALIVSLVGMVLDGILRLRDMAIQFIADLVLGTLVKLGQLVVEGLAYIIRFSTVIMSEILNLRDRFLRFIEDLVMGTLTKLMQMAAEGVMRVIHFAEMLMAAVLHLRDEFIRFIGELVFGTLDKLADLVTKGVAKAKDLASGVIDEIKKLPAQMLQWAGDAVGQFVQGLQDGIGKVGQAAGNLAGAIASHMHFSVPDEGPLADADHYMPDFMELLASGIEANKGRLTTAAASAAAALRGGIAGLLNPSSAASTGISVANTIASSADPRSAQFLAAGDGTPGTGSSVTVHMPDSFASGFMMLDPSVRTQLVTELREEIKRQLGLETRVQSMYQNGYSGFSR